MKLWLKNAKVASALGFVILIALIWFIGALLGVPLEQRFGAIFVVMLLWVVTLLVGRAIAQKAGGLLEGVLRKQADDAVIGAGLDKRADVTMLRQRLLAAIDTLKTSKLGKSSGRAALYELPWYMIIGHPAAGKSSAILQSGLNFPFSDKTGVQGVGGTRNCDWFFSTEGILLDTAGRYATQMEDRSEWLDFLKLLKKHRSRAPANGILVAVSLPELTQHNSEGFEVYARQVRERIHEITNIFGMQVPVYLIFTKLDLLGGFAQFFSEASDEERSEVWGATLSGHQGADFDLSKVVSQQFDLLAKGLTQSGEQRLVQSRTGQAKSAFYSFPIEFRNLKDGVVKFVRLLSEHDPYHARPLLRGFYFSSALQEGTPRIVAAGRVKNQFDLSTEVASDGKVEPASCSYFLRNLFREVIFPDQHLMNSQPQRRNRRRRIAGMAAGLLTLSILAGLWTWSFIGNQQLLTQISAQRAQARSLAASGELYDQLKSLTVLQKSLEELQTYRKNGAPWQVSMGLYQGAAVEQALRKEYFAGLKEVMLKPVQQNLEATLIALKPEAAPAPVPVAAPAPVVKKPAPAAVVSKPVAVKPKPKLKPKPKHGGHPGTGNLPNIQLGAAEVQHPYRALAVAALLDPQTRDQLLRVSQSASPMSGYRMMPVALVVPARAEASAAAAQLAGQPAAAAAPASAQDQKNQRMDVDYNALKTYLMLHDRSHMEEAQLSDQLPRYWRPWLVAHKGQYSDGEIMSMAQQLTAFYVSQVHEPDLPLIDNDAKVVANAREVLRASFKRLSGPEQVFNEIRARANTRYAPLTVARILGNRNLDIVSGSQMVQGAFTREAWTNYVSKALDDASKGEIDGDDWVLASSMQQNLGKNGNVEENRAQLLNLYRAQYIIQWKQFVQGIVVKDFSSPAEAASAMVQLSDPAASPIKLLLNRVAIETSWDNPSELQKSLDTAKKSILEKTAELFNGDASQDKKAVQYGQVGGVFAGIAQLVKGSNPPINGYLAQLAKVKAKLATIASTDAPGIPARSALVGTLNGSGSEMADALAYVDNTLLTPVSADTKEMVRPMLVRPMMQSYASVVGPVTQDINRAWQAEVLPQWRQLSAKYPFKNSSNIASIDEISHFAKPNEGVFDQFVNKYLNGLVQKQGDGLVARSWGGMGLHINPAFLAAAARLSALANSQVQAGASSSFELQPMPTPGLADISFELDGQELHYRNGAQVWQQFTWPGTGQPGARIQATTYSGASVVISSQSGRMGFMNLLANATVEQDNGDSAVLSWKLKKDAGGADRVRFNFRVVGGLNPLQLMRLHDLTLPERVTN